MNNIIQDIFQMKKANQFEPYIKYIVFSDFKNFQKQARLTFDFPVTVLVGANGTNKSSVLKALESCCEGYIISKRWFSTKVDAIPENPVPMFWCAYDLYKKKEVIEAQALNAKYFRKDDPDYWESAKPVIKAGMRRMLNQDKRPFWGVESRWKKIDKTPLYLTFRDSISAFDKVYFYGDSSKKYENIDARKDFIRKNSIFLDNAFTRNSNSKKINGRQKILKNQILPSYMVQAISDILSINYQSIALIEHRFFKLKGFTCKIVKNDMTYTEAFAGSGEFAIIRIVTEIFNSPNYGLILLDEPEVSLHPGAQERLMEFILKQTKLKKLQVVIATHSPAIIRNLPAEAIKVFNLVGDKIQIIDKGCVANEAFYYIGEPATDKKTFIVEDRLARDIILHATKNLVDSQKNLFNVNFHPGGASEIIKTFLISNALNENKNLFLYLDGDLRKEVLSDPNHMSNEEILNSKDSIERNLKIGKLDIPYGSNPTDDIKIDLHKKIIIWIREQILYLPTDNNPEKLICDKSNNPLLNNLKKDHSNPKNLMKAYAQRKTGRDDLNSDQINAYQLELLNEILLDDPDMKNILETVISKIC